MKRCIVLLLIFSVLLLAACQQAAPQTTAGTATKTPNTVPTTQPVITTQPIATTQPIPTTQPTEPIDEEVAKFNALFGELGSWYNKALTCEYETPAQLKLSFFFLAAFNEDSNQITDSERAQLKAVYDGNDNFIDFLHITRLPVYRMNRLLMDYFAITLDEIEDAGFAELLYLQSVDCYYIIGGGASCTMDFNAISVETLEDGLICVYYTANYEDTVYVVTLMPYGDGYRILSNLAV